MSRQFDGVDDTITFAPGAAAILDGVDCTVAFIWKPSAVEAGGIIYGFGAAGAGTFSVSNFSDGSVWYAAGSSFATYTYTGADGWTVVAITNTAGAGGLKSHRYLYGSPGWVHDSEGAGIATGGVGPATELRVGRWDSSGDYLAGHLAAVAVWDRVLANGEIEKLHRSMADWLYLRPEWAVAFNQANVGDGVADLTGGGGDESAIVGTTVSADEPSGWSYATLPTSLNDLIVDKLAQRYTTVAETFADLWKAYCDEFNGGDYLVGDTAKAKYGGTGTLQDRAKAFWTTWNPAVGG
jgi:hypothetical protein